MVRSTAARAELTLAIKACLEICTPAPCDSMLEAHLSEDRGSVAAAAGALVLSRP